MKAHVQQRTHLFAIPTFVTQVKKQAAYEIANKRQLIPHMQIYYDDKQFKTN